AQGRRDPHGTGTAVGLLLRRSPHRDRKLRRLMVIMSGLNAYGATAALPDPLLQIDGVTLEYTTRDRVVRATHRIDLDVYQGDRFVLLGPSGCGKSTLLK